MVLSFSNREFNMEITRSIIPIIINEDKPEHIGSGILLKIKETVFILTAAHVVDDTVQNILLIPTTEGLIKFEGIVTNFEVPFNETRENDIIDIAYFKFDSTWKYEFNLNLKPINIEDINISDIAYETDIYSFIGFPYRKSKIKDGEFIGNLYKYTGGYISHDSFQKNFFNKEANIVINFNRKKMTDNNKILPLPHGISGGGIFVPPKDKHQDSEGKLKLVGITHTYLENKNIMIGTSINFLISSLLQFNSDLCFDIDFLKENYTNQSKTPLIMGFAYYKEEQWNEIRHIMIDKDIMVEDWNVWRLTLERGISEHFNKGKQVIRIVLDINELKEHSRKYNTPLNGKTRTGLVNLKLSKMVYQKEIKFIKK